VREAIYHVAELEAGKLKGKIEIDEAYFGGRRKGRRGRVAGAIKATHPDSKRFYKISNDRGLNSMLDLE